MSILFILLIICLLDYRLTNIKKIGILLIIKNIPFVPMRDKTKLYVIFNNPELLINTSQENIVNIIRNFVSNEFPHASQNFQLTTEIFKQQNVLDIFYYIYTNKGGINCSGYSYILSQIYRDFNLSSVNYYFGNKGAFTHVVTLVEISSEKNTIWIIEDGLYNLTFKTNEKPLSFFHLIKLINNHQSSLIQISKGKNSTREYFCKNDCQGSLKNVKNINTYTHAIENINEKELLSNVNKFINNTQIDDIYFKSRQSQFDYEQQLTKIYNLLHVSKK